jgi:ribosomal protein S15P/S13E
LKLVQSLDERQAEDGKLVLEVKASAHGLIPPLEKIADVKSEGFKIASVDDQGVVVKEYDKESTDVEITTERLWTVTFEAADDLAEKPTAFSFAKPQEEDVEVVYHRYVDADLAEVEPTINLEQQYGEVKAYPMWTIGIGSLLLMGCIGAMAVLNKPKEKKKVEDEFGLPERVTPFTVLNLLKSMQRHNGIPPTEMDRLTGDINRLERHYFVEPEDHEPNLEAIAKDWIGKRSRRNGSKPVGRG